MQLKKLVGCFTLMVAMVMGDIRNEQCEQKLDHLQTQYGALKAKHHMYGHFAEHKNGTGSSFYSKEELGMIEKLESVVRDQKELESLIKYANENFDIPTMKTTFEKNGYLVFTPKVPEEILKEATKFTIALGTNDPSAYNPKGHVKHPCHEKRATCIHDRFDQPGVSGIANDYSIRAVIAALYNRSPYTFQTLNYPYSSQAFTHSDYVHFGTYPADGMCAIWIALEDIHPDAGPLFYYPGSHKMPYLNMQDMAMKTVLDGDYPRYQQRIERIAENMGYNRVTFTPKRGDALIWHGNLLHGGPLPNNAKITRLSQVVHYHFYGNEYGWQPVASRLDKDKVMYINPVGVHQLWGRLPAFKDGTYANKARVGTCFDFPHSPCEQSPFDLGLPPPKDERQRCKTGHGYKTSPTDPC